MQVTIANLSEAHKNERIDSQFFLPEFVESFGVVAKGPHSILSDIAHVTDGNHVKIAENFDDSEGVRYLRGQDLGTDMMLHDRNIVYIPESCFNALKRSHIFKDDILITIVGANTGLVGLVYEPPEKLVANCKLGIARVEKSKIAPGYLYAFLTGRYGQHQVLRSIRGGGQTGLILPDMRQLRITRLSNEFESRINDVSLYGHSKAMESKRVYVNAQKILLSELGLTDWRSKHQLTFVKNHSDTEQVERIDADYFQPKYVEMDKILMKFNGRPIGSCEFLDITTGQYCDNYVAGHEGQPYLRGTDLGVGNVDIDNLVYIKQEDQMPSKQAQEGDVVVTRVGTIGLSARIPKECEGGTISDNLIRVRILDRKKIDSYYLSCFLGSKIGKSLMLRNARGSVQQRLNQETFKEIILPIPEMEIQTKIKHKIVESFDLRKQSKRLLDCAKRAVEMAIEKDEKTASNWLRNKIKEMKIS